MLAVLALVLDALPLSLPPDVLGLLCAAVGIVFGHRALNRTGSGGIQGLAVTALVIGYIAAAVSIAHLIGLGLLLAFMGTHAHHALKP